MSKDYREQAQLEDIADRAYNMYQYFKELSSYERGEYDCIHGYPAMEAEDNDYYDGYAKAYEYLQMMGADK
mgnify:CR=1 FL=1|jgi:hypothetical protein